MYIPKAFANNPRPFKECQVWACRMDMNSQFGWKEKQGFKCHPGPRVSREMVPRQWFGKVLEKGVVEEIILV